MTSGVLNASLMAAWIACKGTEERKGKEKGGIEITTQLESSKTEQTKAVGSEFKKKISCVKFYHPMVMDLCLA